MLSSSFKCKGEHCKLCDKDCNIFFKCGSEICKAPTNSSTAKYRYSFPKAPRFPGDRKLTKEEQEKEKEKEEKRKQEQLNMEEKVHYKKHDYYLLPSTLNRRYCNFGYGNKVDFTGTQNKNKDKSGENDEKKVLTEEERKKQKLEQLNQFAEYEFERKYYHGVKYSIPSFGKDKDAKEKKKREEEIKREEEAKANKKPQKDIEKPFGAEAPYYSIKGIPDPEIADMREKIKGKIEALEKEKESQRRKQVPPHEEQISIQIKRSGKYPLSYIPNVSSVKIQEPDKYKNEQRKKIEKNEKDDYIVEKERKIEELRKALEKQNEKKSKEDEEKLKPSEFKKYLNSLMGQNFQSKYQSHEGIKIIVERHNVKDSRENYPGPGSYYLPSDFGVEIPKNYPPQYQKKEVDDPHPWRHGMKIIKPKENTEPINEDNNEEEVDHNEEENKKEEETPTPMVDGQDQNEEKAEEEDKNEVNNDEDKKSEYMLLRDILTYDGDS